jgi:hypothetical protein
MRGRGAVLLCSILDALAVGQVGEALAAADANRFQLLDNAVYENSIMDFCVVIRAKKRRRAV